MRNKIDITTYPSPHSNPNGGGGGVTYVTYTETDGINNKNAESGRMNFNTVNSHEGKFTYLISGEGTISKITGNDLEYDYGRFYEIDTDSIETQNITSKEAKIDKAIIDELRSQNIVTDYLTVTKQAHFFELIIDKVRAVGGQIILTPAQCIADVVIPYNSQGNIVNLYQSDGTLVNNAASLLSTISYYDIYFRSKDELDHGIQNEWLAGDQAFCKSFNVTAESGGVTANKYYWRLVNSVLPDKMVNFETKELKNPSDTTWTSANNIHITLSPTTYENTPNEIQWTAAAQTIPGIYSNVQWTPIGNQGGGVNGVMKTDSKFLGIQITPNLINTYQLTDKLTFQMYLTDANGSILANPKDIKIGVYYDEGDSQFFSNVEFDANHNVTLNLDSDHAIEAIVIVCSQSVQWHNCHGIRLSNSDCASDQSGISSIPEAGDSIVQLGYRTSGNNDPNAEINGYSRQSAIIIAAYKTPDGDLTAPSYAQYTGINDYNLTSHRGSYIDGKGAQFIGDITLATVGYDSNHNPISMSSFVLDENGIKTQVQSQSQSITELEGDVDGLSGTVETHTTNISSLQQTAQGLTSTVQQQTTEISNLNSSVNGLNETVTTQTDSISSLQQTAQGLTSTVQQQQTKINNLTGEVESQTTDISELKQTAQGLTSTVTSIQNDYVTSSQLTQTANSISATVTENINGDLRTTGIDIEHGKIELNAANTDINGNLNLKNAETGFTLYDGSGNARVNITANNTPSPTSADSNFSANNYVYLNSAWATKSPSTQVNATTDKYSIGTYSSGANINMTIKPVISGTLNNGSGVACNPSNCTCVVRLYRNGNYSSAAYSKSQNVSRQNGDNGYEYSSFTWNLTSISSGTYEVEVNITASESSSGYKKYNVSAAFWYSKIVDSLTYLGLDGILIGTSNKHYAKISKDAYELRWTGITGDTFGGGAIKMSNDGFQRAYNVSADSGPISWVGFDGYCPMKILQSTNFTNSYFYYGDNSVTAYNYKVQANDSIIMIPQGFKINNSTPDLYIRLGDGIGGVNSLGAMPGRKLIIRNLSNCTVYICAGHSSNSQYILNRDNMDFINRISIGNESYTMLAIPEVMSNGDYCKWAIIHKN